MPQQSTPASTGAMGMPMGKLKYTYVIFKGIFQLFDSSYCFSTEKLFLVFTEYIAGENMPARAYFLF